ncbi:MAG TPA: TIM barrel protein [Bryobacteraceae bacterium]|jgi:inosose dehydratase|nr:TIM barrel protein [Bryobacteraceae bacterium]
MQRRVFLASVAGALATAAERLPANRNVKWAVSAGLWSHYPHSPFTDILDVMRDTGFIGVRLTGYPGILKTYNLTASQLEREVAKRGLQVATISFGGPVNDPAQHKAVVEKAREAMRFLQGFGANHLVVFPPSRLKPGQDVDAGFRAMCQGFNRIGEAANEMGFRAGVHNHLDQMVQGPEEVDRCMALTDPKLFNFAPDTAHLYLGGSDVPKIFDKYKHRLVFMDYKDARWTTPKADLVLPNGIVEKKDSPSAKFFESIYDLGDGNIDFPACHRILKQIQYRGWNCVDLDRTRNGPLASYQHCGRYIVNRLEPIYV